MSRFAEVVFNIPVDKSFTYLLPDRLPWENDVEEVPESEDAAMGFRVAASLGARRLVGAVIHSSDRRPPGSFEIRPVDRVIDSKPIFDAGILKLARWIAHTYLCSTGEALGAVLPGAKRQKSDPAETIRMNGEESERFSLAEQQETAVSSILSNPAGTYYLQGVTGSGKTEVFLRVAEAMLERGRGVIYLVPEISLVPQVEEAFRTAFDDRVAVLHSGMKPSMRLREWMRVRCGEASLVIGARSAVFAPLRSLGLIVIDEEHENSYKSGSTPRYHARQVAAHRCRDANAVLLMGSATPSVEAYHRMEDGRLRRLRLPERLSGGAMPSVEIVDMKGEGGVISSALFEGMRDVHRQGRQSILFLNRRGFTTYFACRSCGYEMKCRRCSVSLTYHKKTNRMICHYCGYRTDPLSVCPGCGSLDIGYSGFGTEKIEEEIKTLLPELRVRRIDTDAVRRKLDLGEALGEFRAGIIDVLLGTQMVAKGLNFPGVKLVGIVSADVGMQMPDFRALERTFSLIVQVSGRAGRMIPDGRVMIQTYRPENPVLRMAAELRLDEFYAQELEVRKQLQFPPFVRIIRLVFRGRSEKKTTDAAAEFMAILRGSNQKGASVELMGPAECPVGIIAANHRHHILVKSREVMQAHRMVERALLRFKPAQGVYLEIDVDPQSLL